MKLIKNEVADKLKVNIYATRKDMGQAAAEDCAAVIRKLLEKKDVVNMIFAAAPSQNEMLEGLCRSENIDWSRIRAFHMDEYIGLADDAPQGFGNFLKDRLFSKLNFKEVHYLKAYGTAEECCERYSALLKEYPTDIVCLGIGENGHIAFNDPHVAKFEDTQLVKVVELDLKCRNQQVNDGCFNTLEDVPEYAVTLTIPALCKAQYMFCVVPGELKANAVFDTVRGEIGEYCPATVMRNHENAILYADSDSAKYVLFKKAVITDEISQDLSEAIELAKKYHYHGLEIRSIENTTPENFTDAQVEKIVSLAKENQMEIVSVCSSVFKCDWGEDDNEKFEKTIRVAKKLGSPFIRCFSFWKNSDYSDDAFVALLKKYEARLKEEKIVMLLEADPSVNLSCGAAIARCLDLLRSDWIQSIWDPGNNIYGEDNEIPYPDGYQALKPYIKHIHIKDATKTKVETVGTPVGKGEVDYIGQFTALLADGYNGWVSMETHYKKGSKIAEDVLKRPSGDAISYMGYESTEECMQGLEEVIHTVCSKKR